MENKETEQAVIVVAEMSKTNENQFGKFKDADSLFNAYKALESEFTKRSQELVAAKEAVKNAREEYDRLTCNLNNILDDDDFVVKAADDERVYNKAIEKFLITKRQTPNIPMLNNEFGVPAVSGVVRPKTLEEAARIALKIINS